MALQCFRAEVRAWFSGGLVAKFSQRYSARGKHRSQNLRSGRLCFRGSGAATKEAAGMEGIRNHPGSPKPLKAESPSKTPRAARGQVILLGCGILAYNEERTKLERVLDRTSSRAFDSWCRSGHDAAVEWVHKLFTWGQHRASEMGLAVIFFHEPGLPYRFI